VESSGLSLVRAAGLRSRTGDEQGTLAPGVRLGDVPGLPHDDRLQRQIADFLHHGDKTIPPQQQFGGFARSLLAGRLPK
jgi:hypothetical protein